MYAVRRPFKSYGKAFTYGDIINNPSEVKLFKAKVAEGKILEVTDANYEHLSVYFKTKYGVELPSLKQDTEEVINTDEVSDTEEVLDEVKEEQHDKEPKVNNVKASVVVKPN